MEGGVGVGGDEVGFGGGVVGGVREVGEDEFSEHTQLFLMIKKPGANTGLLWTTYAFRGVELIGALESAKLIAAERYFNGDD